MNAIRMGGTGITVGRRRKGQGMLGQGGAAVPWYLAGGIDPSIVIGAYEAAGSQSLFDSYRNLANIGYFHLTVGAVPTLGADGWAFNGSSQYLITGITADKTWSMVAQFSEAPVGNQVIAGYYSLEANAFAIRPNHTGGSHNVWSGVNSGALAGGLTGGTFGMSNRAVLVNGVNVATMAAGTTANGNSLWIGRSNNSALWYGGKVQRLFIANAAITDAQALALHTAMLASSGPVTVTRQIVCEGDSLTIGQGSTGGNSYPNQMWHLLGATYRVRNLGVSGDRLNELTTQAAATDAFIDVALAKNILVVWAGTNDMYLDGETGAATYSELATYCQARQAAGWTVVVVTCLPRSPAGIAASFEIDRTTLNGSIRGGWATFASALADIAADSRIGDAGDSNDTTYYDADKNHLNNTGYVIVAGIVRAAVATIA